MRSIIAALACVSLVGCGLDVLTTTAITGELQKRNVENVSEQMERAESEQIRWQVERAIQAYQAEEGENPPSLEALVPNYLPSVPEGPAGEALAYDPRSGRLAPQAGGPAPSDMEAMSRLRQAIQQYGMQTGYYPPALEALTPHFLSEVPRTASGEPFLYDPRNGALAHPQQQQARSGSGPAQAPQGGRQQPMGVSPMVDSMTGLSAQEELQRGYSSSGAQHVGNRMRGQVRGIEREYGREQERMAEEMDLW